MLKPAGLSRAAASSMRLEIARASASSLAWRTSANSSPPSRTRMSSVPGPVRGRTPPRRRGAGCRGPPRPPRGRSRTGSAPCGSAGSRAGTAGPPPPGRPAGSRGARRDGGEAARPPPAALPGRAPPSPQLVAQEAHDDAVEIAAALVAVVAQTSFLAEADLLVAGDPARVVLVDFQVDAVQVQLREAPPAERAHGIGAVAPAPAIAASQGDPQLRRAVPPVDGVEAPGADVEPLRRLGFRWGAPRVDGEGLGGRLLAQRPFEPFLLVGEAQGIAEGEVLAHLGVVQPLHEAGQIAPLDAAQPDPLAEDHGVDHASGRRGRQRGAGPWRGPADTPPHLQENAEPIFSLSPMDLLRTAAQDLDSRVWPPAGRLES